MAENMYLTGAFFDNNMPQWATEETLSRLSQQIKSSNNLSKNQQNKVIGLLQGIAQSLKSGDEKKMLKEMEKFNKTLDSARSDIVDQTKKSSSEISNKLDKQTDAIDKQTQAIEKQTEAIDSASKSQEKESGKTTEQTKTQITREKINVEQLEQLTSEVNTNVKAISSTLNDFHKSFMNISSESLKTAQGTKEAMLSSSSGSKELGETKVKIEKTIDNSQEDNLYSPDNYKNRFQQQTQKNDTGDDNESKSSKNKKRGNDKDSYGSEMVEAIKDSNDTLRDIVDELRELDARRSRMKGESPSRVREGDDSPDRLEGLLEDSKNQRNLREKAGEGVNKTRRAGSKIKRTVGVLDGVLGKLITPLTVLSTAISSLTALKAAFDATKDVIWDAQEEVYDAMHETGVSFSTFNSNLENVEDDIRMDGIRLRRMIGEAGILAEKGIEVIRNNSVLMNRMGTQGFFGAIQNIAGDAKDMESFMNQMMLSRDQIAEFTSQYMSSLIKVGGQMRMNEENRQQYIRRFIEDASQFSRVLGKGVKEFTKRIDEIREDDRTRLMQMKLSGKEMARFENVTAAITSMNMSEDIKGAFMDALHDPRGIGLRGSDIGRNLLNGLERLGMGEVSNNLQTLIKETHEGNIGTQEFAKRMLEIREQLKENGASEQQIDALLAGNDQLRKAVDFRQGTLQLDQEMLGKMASGEDVSPAGQTGETTQKQRLAQAAIKATEAQLQEEKARAFDSNSGREAAVRSFEAAVVASDVTERIAKFVSSIASAVIEYLPKLLDLVEWIYNAIPGVDSAEEKRRDQQYQTAISGGTNLAGAIKAGKDVEYDEGGKFGTMAKTEGQKRNEMLEQTTRNKLELLARAKEAGPDSEAWQMLREKDLKDNEIKAQIKQVPKLMELAGEKYGEGFAKKIEDSAKRYGEIAEKRRLKRYESDIADMTGKDLRKEMDRLSQQMKKQAKAAIPEEFSVINMSDTKSSRRNEIQDKAKEQTEKLEERVQLLEQRLEQERKEQQERINKFNNTAEEKGIKKELGGPVEEMIKSDNFDMQQKTDMIEENIENRKRQDQMISLLEKIVINSDSTAKNTRDSI